jgi:hypothetical protein
MMFLFTHPNCPQCGAAGAIVNTKHDVRMCACCKTMYNEFAVVREGADRQEELEPS